MGLSSNVTNKVNKHWQSVPLRWLRPGSCTRVQGASWLPLDQSCWRVHTHSRSLHKTGPPGSFQWLKYVKIRLRVWFKQSEAGKFQLKPKLSLQGSNNPELQTKQEDEVDTFLPLTMTNKNHTFLGKGNSTLKLRIKFQVHLK